MINELERLQAEMAKCHKLKSVLVHLESDRDTLVEGEKRLAKLRQKEQGDVDSLERVSFASIAAAIRGNKEEKLRKEEAEAQAAVFRHDAAVRRVEKIEREIENVRNERNRLAGCEEKLWTALDLRLEEIKSSGCEAAQKIHDLEARIAFLDAQQREIQEAIIAGGDAMRKIESIESSLKSAENWGIYDMIGGGTLSPMAKHSHLDEAQEQVEYLQRALNRFRRELTDIRISVNLQIQIDGFLRFADYFFDGLFADWAVLDRINDSQEQVAHTKSHMYAVIQRLRPMLGEAEKEQAARRRELDGLAGSG